MKAYSQDLREKIVAALRSGEWTQAELAVMFSVSLSFIEKLWRRQRETGQCAALPHGGGPTRVLQSVSATLRHLVSAQPDRTLQELCDDIAQQEGLHASRSMMCRALQRLHLPRKKKSLSDSQRETPRVQALRDDFRTRACDWLVARLKFVDEMGVHLGLTRLFGRAAPGQRVVESAPNPRHSPYTLIGTLGWHGLSAVAELPGTLDGAACEVYVQAVLGPTLRQGDIVLMDNLSAHTIAPVRAAIEARGARLEFLPPYSPEWNPIELCWSKLKTVLRAAKARTYDELMRALDQALQAVSTADIRAWFEFCGYSSHP